MKPFHLLAETLTPDKNTLTLYEHDGQMHLKLNGRALMSTNATASEVTLAELACDGLGSKPDARVLIGGLGFGYTLRRTLDLVAPQAKVQVAELLPEVVAWNREFLRSVNGELLDDGRVEVTVDDVCNVINTAPSASYDAIMLDVDNGPNAMVHGGNDRLYYQGGFDRLQRVLKPGGRVAFWSATKDRPFEKRLAKAGFKVSVVGAKAYVKARRPTHTIFLADAPGAKEA